MPPNKPWLSQDPALAQIIGDHFRQSRSMIDPEVRVQLFILEHEIRAAYALLLELLQVESDQASIPNRNFFSELMIGCAWDHFPALSQVVMGATARLDPHVEYILALRNIPYWMYLKSNHWQTVRSRTGKRFDYRCALCGTNDQEMHTHHNNYAQLGFESEADVIRLCKDCHAANHKRWVGDVG